MGLCESDVPVLLAALRFKTSLEHKVEQQQSSKGCGVLTVNR